MPATFAFYRADCSPYSHVELLQAAPMAGEAMCISASKRDGNKVRSKRIAFKPGHWDFIEVPHRISLASHTKSHGQRNLEVTHGRPTDPRTHCHGPH